MQTQIGSKSASSRFQLQTIENHSKVVNSFNILIACVTKLSVHDNKKLMFAAFWNNKNRKIVFLNSLETKLVAIIWNAKPTTTKYMHMHLEVVLYN